MPRRWTRFALLPALAGITLCVLVAAVDAAAPTTMAWLQQTESLRTANHPQFVRQLAQLHQQAPGMSSSERWYLHYLDAWETSFQGDTGPADAMLQDVIEHSGDPSLMTKASAVLLDDLGATHHYEQAFELANRLIAYLPKTTDPVARFMALAYVAQLLRTAGQYELSATYAREMEQARPPGETSCKPTAILMATLYETHKLSPATPELLKGIATCQAAGEPIFADTIWLVMGSLYLDAGQPAKAIALLRQIAPSIQANQFYSHRLSAKVMLAQAYAQLGKDDDARKAASAAVAMGDPGDIDESLRDAYDVLYRLAKKHNNPAAALAYYEHYVAQDKSALNDIGARALAYQVAQQHMLVQKLETERLNRQNHILRLQQALDGKAMETSRLSIALLMLVLASAVFWLYRTKRSQLRFKQLSQQDSLTGILNHQHFMHQAARGLRLLDKKQSHACLILVDLDHFKQVNDTHGHSIGDAVLKHATAVCGRQLRAKDLYGRLGGEEFGILLRDCSRVEGMAIAHRICVAIAATPMEHDGLVVSISASAGLASTDSCGYALQRLCMEADAALYRAKRGGRNRVIADTQDDGLVEA